MIEITQERAPKLLLSNCASEFRRDREEQQFGEVRLLLEEGLDAARATLRGRCTDAQSCDKSQTSKDAYQHAESLGRQDLDP